MESKKLLKSQSRNPRIYNLLTRKLNVEPIIQIPE